MQKPYFSTPGYQSNGKTTLKRMEWEFKGKSYKFVLNPEEYTQTEVARVNVTQTKGGAWVDDFGGGIPLIVIKGITGFRNSSGQQDDGFYKFKELRDLIRSVYFDHPPGTEIVNELIFHNYTDGEDWIVVPKMFTLLRSVSRPLLYSYEIQLICVRPANQPSASQIQGSASSSSAQSSSSGFNKITLLPENTNTIDRRETEW